MAAVGHKSSPQLGHGRNDLPKPGNEIICTTSDGKSYKGNVSVFDNSLRAVVIENENDGQIHVINLQNIGQVDVIKNSQQDTRYTFHQIDYNKVRRRYEEAVQKRMQEAIRTGDGVSKGGQQLFDKLYNVYSDTRWDGHDIVVMGDVRIVPPYQPGDCSGKSEDALEIIRKIVKRISDQESQPSDS